MAINSNVTIEALTEQLVKVQEKKSSIKLSERNIVELIIKLRNLEILDDDILYTIDGQSYLTRQYLKNQILQTIKKSGGRISISYISGILKVDIIHCIREINDITNETDEIFQWKDDVITKEYLNQIKNEINEILIEYGMIQIGDIVDKYGLSEQKIMNMMSDMIMKGKIIGKTVFNDTYLKRIKGEIRGCLRACVYPYHIQSLSKLLNLGANNITTILQTIINDLIQSNSIKGQLKSSGEWIPEIYVKRQLEKYSVTYSQNNWITLNEINVELNQEIKNKYFEKSIKLDSVLISDTLILCIISDIMEADKMNTWYDIALNIPEKFNKKDIKMIVQQCNTKEIKNKFIMMSDTCFVTIALIQKCNRYVCEVHAEKMARDAFDKLKNEKLKLKESSTIMSELNKEKELEENWNENKNKGKKKSKQKQKLKTNNNTEVKIIEPSVEDIRIKIEEWMPELSELSKFISNEIYSDFMKEFKENIKKLMSMGSERRQEYIDISLNSIKDTYRRFEIYIKALDILKDDYHTQNIIKMHIIKTNGTELYDWLLRYFQFQDHGIDLTELDIEKLIPIQSKNKISILNELSEDLKESALIFQNALKLDDLKDIILQFDEAIKCCNLRFKKLDKKSEKEYIMNYTNNLKLKLKLEENYPNALTLTLPIIFSNIYGLILNIPGRAIPGIIAVLKESLDERDYGILENYHTLVVDYLKLYSNSNPENETLKQLLPDIKRIANVSDN